MEDKSATAETKVESVPVKNSDLDLYALFKQIDGLREEGVPEEVIRVAFNEFMADRQGTFRVPLKRILKTPDSMPTLTQQEINKMYESRIRKPSIDKDYISENMADLMMEVERAISRRHVRKYSPFKRFLCTVAYLILKFPVGFIVWVMGKFASKYDSADDDGDTIGIGIKKDD